MLDIKYNKPQSKKLVIYGGGGQYENAKKIAEKYEYEIIGVTDRNTALSEKYRDFVSLDDLVEFVKGNDADILISPYVNTADILATLEKLGLSNYYFPMELVLTYDFHKISQVYDLLQSDFSKMTYQTVLRLRSNDKRYVDAWEQILRPSICQYFDMLNCINQFITFLDVGAFCGESTERLLLNGTVMGVDKIYAFEPNHDKLSAISRRFDRLSSEWAIPRGNFVIVPKGAGDKKTTLGGKIQNSQIVIGDSSECRIEIDTIDHVLNGERADFIKMDIEGAELSALKGAYHTIKKDMPFLAICIYHKSEDFYEIPLWLHENFPEYKFDCRHYSRSFAETVLYAYR